MSGIGLRGICVAGMVWSPVAALAQESVYLDDRSDPVALVESYYNAINRKEFARAWGYFGEDKPAPDFDAFAAGFEGTDRVDVLTGAYGAEGAAGSVYYTIAVAIRAVDEDGTDSVFAGCYTARLANPQIQSDPFEPMHLVEGALEPADTSLQEALPPQCGDSPPLTALERDAQTAERLLRAAHGEECSRTLPDGADVEPESHTIAFRYASDGPETAERKAHLFRFYCGAGAYNENHVYYLADEVGGVRELQFASPELDIRYENDNPEEKVDSIRTIGFETGPMLVNSGYDPETYTIMSHNKWRGIGDASSTGTWLFRDGRFTLVRYDVDASYDGEINPETVLDYNSGP
ncbi:DUF1176 domain-containing protein [Mesorhizobium xinjiangense]|uniref:DUF1176 domain-containing protein n=1 Tax=Mesorhizobium xinjiangense TaxID=2678685 RepID=UPI0012ED7F9C|nr:DUF1176 domain-containing protein [Mesorhizobium xinjiangense]